MPGLRTTGAVWAAKTAAFASRALGRGGGTAVGGVVGLALDPSLVSDLAPRLAQGSILITGTNGKTTTSRLIAAAARNAGVEPLANTSGSNLMRGLASTLALANLSIGDQRLGVFEVDEATVPLALSALKPRVAVFLNLFRDQLDRYGEVDAVASRWRDALANAPDDLHLVLNADDPAVAALGEGRTNVTYFGVDDDELDRGCLEHASDSLTCTCGARLQYDAVYLSHVGRWRCDSCGRKRPTLDVSATGVDLRDGRSLSFDLRAGDQTMRDIDVALGGLYNVYNALAAFAGTSALGLSRGAVATALSATGAAFGRQESFEVDERRVELYLGKNPAGLNQVLQTLLLDPQRRVALILLNDNIADGRDVSWVWDADFEVAAGKFDAVVTSGTRAAEMALRLKYAGWDESHITVEPDVAAALQRALDATPAGETLTIVPTYTAMLTVRDLLAKRTGRSAFWQ